MFTANFEASLYFGRFELLAHNNISQMCYCGQISFINCSFYDNLTPLVVTFILLASSDGRCHKYTV